MYKAVKYSLYEATEKLVTPILNCLANESLLDVCKNETFPTKMLMKRLIMGFLSERLIQFFFMDIVSF